MSSKAEEIKKEVGRRRSFAIISHPDAGKTTMTEKLLLYGGAIHMAGSVKARKASRHATSDWMEIEKQRGISVSSSVMQFEYGNCCVNILDTPGHQDFSEDTYRTLYAADSAVMLIDGAKGVEPQTIKLFQVCRLRKIPIFTFINKMDRASKPPFDLLDELEKVLGIFSYPMNWPIGTDGDFQGIYLRDIEKIEFYGKEGNHGSKMLSKRQLSLDDADLGTRLEESYINKLKEDIELINIAGEEFSEKRISEGSLTPVFFGSAINNFGIEYFLNHFLKMAPCPGERPYKGGTISSESEKFSGFIFKIQANMDPNHRDRLAFLRICSGKFEKNMEVELQREKKKIRLTQPQQFMAQEHKATEEAFPGDIIGLFDPGTFRIGDSLSETGSGIEFNDIPVFAPEHFAKIEAEDSLKRKQFLKGMEQIAQEGGVQLFKEYDTGTETYVVGVVGELQFDVLEYRLKNEYRVNLRRVPLPYRFARWVSLDGKFEYDKNISADLNLTSTTLAVQDRDGAPVLLFESEWAMNWAIERNTGLLLSDIQGRSAPNVSL